VNYEYVNKQAWTGPTPSFFCCAPAGKSGVFSGKPSEVIIGCFEPYMDVNKLTMGG